MSISRATTILTPTPIGKLTEPSMWTICQASHTPEEMCRTNQDNTTTYWWFGMLTVSSMPQPSLANSCQQVQALNSTFWVNNRACTYYYIGRLHVHISDCPHGQPSACVHCILTIWDIRIYSRSFMRIWTLIYLAWLNPVVHMHCFHWVYMVVLYLFIVTQCYTCMRLEISSTLLLQNLLLL